MAEALNM